MNSIHSNRDGTAKYKELFNLYYSPLVGFALSYLKDEAEAEDVVQDVFCNMWKAKDMINYNSNVKSLLFTSTKNRCISHIRSKICNNKFRTAEQTKIDNQAQLNIIALEYTTLKYVEFNELKEQVDNILGSLPEDMKRIFILNREYGKSYIEIAEELDISVKTVEKKMSNTLKVFRKNLSDYDFMLFILFM